MFCAKLESWRTFWFQSAHVWLRNPTRTEIESLTLIVAWACRTAGASETTAARTAARTRIEMDIACSSKGGDQGPVPGPDRVTFTVHRAAQCCASVSLSMFTFFV